MSRILGHLPYLTRWIKVGCEQIVFSSSATVYGETGEVPSLEDARTRPANPCRRQKSCLLKRSFAIGARSVVAVRLILRYFNPIGAHESGIIGEDPMYSKQSDAVDA